MKRAWMLAVLLACTPAMAQFGNLLKGLDPSKLIDTGKKLSESNREFSEPEEIAMGEGIASGLLGAAPLSRDAALQRYVNRVGRWVALHSDRPDLPWTFGVIAGEGINAFSMPGGTIVVSEGLLRRLRNESELAGALGHEVAHVVLRHQISAIQSSMRTGAFAGITGDLLSNQIGRQGGDAITREAKSRLADAGVQLVKDGFILRPLDRGMEYDADRMAITLAARSGYDPYGLVGVLQMLAQAKGDGSGTAVFDTHPAAEDRIAELERSQSMLDRYAAQAQNEARYRQVMGAAK